MGAGSGCQQAVPKGEFFQIALVTQHGRPVARLAPLAGGRAREGRLAELVRAGLVREPRRQLGRAFLAGKRPADREGRSLEVALEERAEGW